MNQKKSFRKLLTPQVGLLIGLAITLAGAILTLQKSEKPWKKEINKLLQNFSLGLSPSYKLYQNNILGIKFLYPESYTKLTEELYPLPLITFTNHPSCVDKLTDDRYEYRESESSSNDDCFMLDIWQQPKPYDVSYSIDEDNKLKPFYRDACFQSNNTYGTIRTLRGSGASNIEVTTIQIPRYENKNNNKTADELILQYSYRPETLPIANEVLKTLLESLKVEKTYAKISPPRCCQKRIPTVFISSGKKFFLLEHNQLREIPLALKEDSVGGEKISPDGSKIAFLYWNKERDSRLYGPPKSGVAIVETTPPYQITRVVEPGTNIHTHLSWSPNGRYLSYVLNEGDGVVMLDTLTQQEVFRLVITGNHHNTLEHSGSPVVWLNENQFSFVYDGKLYLGNPDNPTREIIANGVINVEGGSESPRRLYKPLWSPDGRYVTYRKKHLAVLQDTTTGEEYPFGVQIGGESGYYLNTLEIGWISNNEFLFEGWDHNAPLKVAKVTSYGLLNIQDMHKLLDKGSSINYDLIEDKTHVVAYSDLLTQPLKILNLNSKSLICNGLKASKYYSSLLSKQGDTVYLAANPLVPQVSHWPYEGFVDQAKRILEIFDLNSCESLGGVVIDQGDGAKLNVEMVAS